MSPVPTKAFRYLCDPIFQTVAMAYVVNRWIMKPYFPNVISISYLNDIICIPFCVPIMLWGMQKAGWRSHNLPPQPAEVLIPLLVIAVLFEIIIPELNLFRGKTFADPADILCYVAGAWAAMILWNRYYGIPPKVASSAVQVEVDLPLGSKKTSAKPGEPDF